MTVIEAIMGTFEMCKIYLAIIFLQSKPAVGNKNLLDISLKISDSDVVEKPGAKLALTTVVVPHPHVVDAAQTPVEYWD